MKNVWKVSAGFCSLVLALVSIWATLNPVIAYAASASGSCGPGKGSVTCSGISCQSQDSSAGATGYCACTTADGSVQVKYCAGEGGPVPEENDN